MRFAPAPTGYLHVGGARTALFNWLFARRTGGTFILRIEDTDAALARDELVDGIGRALNWLGIDWDEGPVRQSEFRAMHEAAADQLVAGNRAYWCDCSRDDVLARAPEGASPGYDGWCRDRGLPGGQRSGAALRFRTPDDGSTVIHDLVRGEVEFEHVSLEDFVVLRGDGSPTFLLANAVDDAAMAISHVVRGEDLLASTPRVLLLRHALGYAEDPVFAHLPLLVNAKRQKLSKRRDDVAIEEFRERGYLPEAMRNFLALLGWAPSGDREIVSVQEMIDEFRLEDVKSAPAFFDVAKLDHLNGEYVRAMPTDRFVAESLPWLEVDPPWPPERFDLAEFEALAPLVQERVRTLAEVAAMVDFLFLDAPVVDPAAWDKSVARQPAAAAILDEVAQAFGDCAWEAEVLHDVVAEAGTRHGLKLAKAQAPVRVAVTGRSVGPPLFESLEVLGRDRSLERVAAAARRAHGGAEVQGP